MKADVYSGFLTDKVKVFSTKKGVSPLVLPKRLLQKARPFMLASAMMVTFSCRNNAPSWCKAETTDKTELRAEWQSVYDEVVKTYRLTELCDKEPLDGAYIEALMKGRDVPVLTDSNFNHRAENAANFWEIVKNGIKTVKEVQISPALTLEQKKEYELQAVKMLSQISRIKGTENEVDLSDYNNMKAFLYFEKVVQYKDDYEAVMEKSDGWIDERAEALGRYYKDYIKLDEKISKYSGVEKFAKALYLNDDRLLISPKDSMQANALSRKMLADWLEAEDIKDKGLWYFTKVEDDAFCNAIAYWYKRGNTFGVSLGVDMTGRMRKGTFSPVGTIIIHEMQHVMQMEPASREKSEDNRKNGDVLRAQQASYDTGYLAELGPTLYSLALEDKIYKEIHGIEAQKVVDYGTIDTGDGKVGLGEVAVWFAKMINKYPTKSVDELLGQKEVIERLNHWGNGTVFVRGKAFER